MRRIVVEMFIVFAIASAAGAYVARRFLVEPAVEAIRQGARTLPAPSPGVAQQADTDRRTVPLSRLLDSVRTTDGGAVVAPTNSAHTTQAPSVRREGSRVHIDLQGAAPNSDALAGATVIPRDPSLGGGFEVTSVDQAGLLAAAGIRAGDVIIAVNGMPTRTPDEALAAFASAHATPSATLRLERENRTFEVTADLVR